MNAKTALCLAAAGIAVLGASAHRARPGPLRTAAAPPFRVRGAPHVHTGFSPDGGGTVDDVARAARATGLQFVVVTDHNTQAALPEAGYHQGVLVISGMEKSTDAGHALVLGTGPLPFGLDGDPQEVARDARRFGGFVVAAHPSSGDPDLRWSGGWVGIDGLEVLNFGQADTWPRPGPAAGLFLARYAQDPTSALLQAFAFSRAALELWDSELAVRRVAGVLGTDAHGGVRVGSRRLPFPAHARIFALASQYVLLDRALTGDARSDTGAVLDALRRGRGYVSVDALGDAGAFAFDAVSGGVRAGPGEDLPLGTSARLTADSGGVPGARLVLLRDGTAIAEGDRIDTTTDAPGVHRVEGYIDGNGTGRGRDRLPWVISNPVFLFPPAVLAARAARAAAPSPTVATGTAAEVLDDFSRPLGPEWQVERSPDAIAASGLEDNGLRFDFALGPTAPSHADLVRWKPLSLEGASALMLRVRAQRTMRFDLQVRTAWQGHDPPVRIWRRSIRAEPEWSEIAVPLDALKTYDRQAGRPDLARVIGLYVHVDEAIASPAARGTLWVDDLAVLRATANGARSQ